MQTPHAPKSVNKDNLDPVAQVALNVYLLNKHCGTLCVSSPRQHRSAYEGIKVIYVER